MGGRFGEMSTFLNYTFQSFNFRNRQGARPFYDLVANVAAEEFGHVRARRGDDQLHNYSSRQASRNGKLKVYEMVEHPAARALTGYLLVRGGVHQVASSASQAPT